MGNTNTRAGESVVETYSAYDEINRGTVNRPRPLLKFHTVHGENVELLQDGRIARRKDSFCKGLVFSNRPIGVDEIVCLRLCEVGTNWSGVLRFGVSNVDPASFRDIELPKFACPDLTSKSGYWAKALAERYSMDKAILHFFVNSGGELYYGINGINKGLFLNGINVSLPLWIIIDIYGNSVGVEFLDPADVNLRSIKSLRNKRNTAFGTPVATERPRSIVDTSDLYNNNGASTPISGFVTVNESSVRKTMSSSTSATNLLQALNTSGGGNNGRQFSSARTSPFTQQSASSRLRFHTVKGVNISLDGDDLIATRRHGEYYLGYVFTERPIRIDEKLCIAIMQTEDAFTGSLSFGLTSCDPTTMPASRLPIDNDELLERPEYWVCIKDVAAQPVAGDRLTFIVDCAGQVHFAKNDAPPRVIMHVDVSVNLWAFFDLYGTTRKIQLIDCQTLSTGSNTVADDNLRNHRASSEGSSSIYHHHQEPPASSSTHQQRNSRTAATSVFNLDGLRVALPPPESSSSVDSLNGDVEAEITAKTSRATSSRGSGSSPSIPIPSAATGDGGERSSRHSSGGSTSGLATAGVLRGGVTSTNAPTFFNISPTPSASSSSAPLSAVATTTAGGTGTLDPDLWSFRSSLLRRLQQSSVNDLHSASSAPSMCQGSGARSGASGSHYNSGGSHYHNHHHHSQLSSSPHDASSSPFDTSRYMSLLSSAGSAAAARRRMSASPRSERRDISGDSTATAAVTTPSPLSTTPTHSSSIAASAAATAATVANFRNTLSEAMESALSGTGSAGFTQWTPSTATTVSSNTSPLFSTFATTVPSSSTGGATFSSTTITPTSRRSQVAAAATTIASTTRTWEQQLKAQKSLEDPSDGGGGAASECSICMNSRVNAVIYRCGHMCMCFACAKETHRRSGDCPICRTPIIDVIRCYPA